MTTTRYDFTEAEKQLQWCSPSELSADLKNAALRLSFHDEDAIDSFVREMQQAALNACDFLDAIKQKEVKP